jgi:hypothetical protein
MPIAVVAAVAAIGATVGSTVMQMSAAKKQKKAVQRQVAAQEDQNRIERAKAAVMNQRERVQQVREARIRRAQVISGASNAGVGVTGGSSGVQGATGAVQSNLGYNLGTLGSMSSFAEQLSAANQREADAQADFFNAGAKGQMWQSIFGAVGQVAGGVNSFMGGSKSASTSWAGGNTHKSIFGG